MGQSSTFNSFVDGPKLGGVAVRLWSHADICMVFDRMEK